ncbi:hypothetical protein ABIC28_001025 [Rhodococcus sp. PvR044]
MFEKFTDHVWHPKQRRHATATTWAPSTSWSAFSVRATVWRRRRWSRWACRSKPLTAGSAVPNSPRLADQDRFRLRPERRSCSNRAHARLHCSVRTTSEPNTSCSLSSTAASPPVPGYSVRSHPWTSPRCVNKSSDRSRSICCIRQRSPCSRPRGRVLVLPPARPGNTAPRGPASGTARDVPAVGTVQASSSDTASVAWPRTFVADINTASKAACRATSNGIRRPSTSVTRSGSSASVMECRSSPQSML